MRSAFARRNSQKRENGPNLALIMTKKKKNNSIIRFYFEKRHKIC